MNGHTSKHDMIGSAVTRAQHPPYRFTVFPAHHVVTTARNDKDDRSDIYRKTKAQQIQED